MLVAAWHIKHYNLVNYVSGSGQLWCLLWSWIGLQRLPSGPYCCLLSWWDMNATWTHSTFTMRWHKSVMSSVSFICHKCNIFCAPILVLHEAILWHYTWRWIQRYNARARVQAPKTKHEFQISSLTTGLGWDSTMRYWGSSGWSQMGSSIWDHLAHHLCGWAPVVIDVGQIGHMVMKQKILWTSVHRDLTFKLQTNLYLVRKTSRFSGQYLSSDFRHQLQKVGAKPCF